MYYTSFNTSFIFTQYTRDKDERIITTCILKKQGRRALDRDWRRVLVNTVMNHQVP
jgi:hypothetical protein